jgi:flagellar basal-body rod protein FlgC
MTGIFGSLDTAASGLTAERLRMDVVANNLANANTTRTASGGAYRRQEVVLEERGAPSALPGSALASTGGAARSAGHGVQVAGIVEDRTPLRMVYDPGHPDANAQGYVQMPNVNPVTEMSDLITATRAYEANSTAINAIKSEATRALDVLR